MKKFLGTISAVVIICLLFAGCTGNNGANNQNGSTNAVDQNDPTNAVDQNSLSNELDQNEPWKDVEGGQIAVAIATDILDGAEVEHINVSGHPDLAIEERLNGELYAFSTWGDAEGVTLDFAVVGNFLSVRRTGTQYTEGAAYPINFLQTQIFDLTTGEQAGRLSDFVKIGPELREVITSGAFRQVYPEGLTMEGATERLAVEIVDNYDPEYFDLRFYLTETSFGLYIETLHVEGDYWAFEAPYADIRPSVQTKLALELLYIYED